MELIQKALKKSDNTLYHILNGVISKETKVKTTYYPCLKNEKVNTIRIQNNFKLMKNNRYSYINVTVLVQRN